LPLLPFDGNGREREWQIMLEQFIAIGVVVKDEVIDIDSD
jgi:hypothetical protein